jgi:hypothetical protein
MTNVDFKDKCFENYYSYLAFQKLDVRLCKNIKDSSLKSLCEKNIIRFIAKRDSSPKECEKLP